MSWMNAGLQGGNLGTCAVNDSELKLVRPTLRTKREKGGATVDC